MRVFISYRVKIKTTVLLSYIFRYIIMVVVVVLGGVGWWCDGGGFGCGQFSYSKLSECAIFIHVLC